MDQCDQQFAKAENYASDYGIVPNTKRKIKRYVRGKIVSNSKPSSLMNKFIKHQSSTSTYSYKTSLTPGLMSPNGSDSTGTNADSVDS